MLLLSSSLSLSLCSLSLFFGLCLTRYLLKCYQRATKKYFNCLCTSVSSSTVVAVCGHCQQIMQPEINDNNNSKGGAQRGAQQQHLRQQERATNGAWKCFSVAREWEIEALIDCDSPTERVTDWLTVWVYDCDYVCVTMPAVGVWSIHKHRQPGIHTTHTQSKQNISVEIANSVKR